VDLEQEYVDLVPVIRRVVAARVKDPHTVEDLVQETLARVMAARSRVSSEKLAPYAAVTARNLVASLAERNDRARDRSHLLVDPVASEPLVEGLLREEQRSVVTVALANLPAADRDLLIAHEVEGQDTSSMAASRGSTPGAVAARLSRARASLRIEYLLAMERVEPPSDRCRPVLRALSSRDRRRQLELDVDGHVLGCHCCSRVRERLFEQRSAQTTEGEARVTVARDADVVVARQRGREISALVGFSATDLTLIATAISEVARNIVKFAERGEVVISSVSVDGRRGVSIVARDVGPGIPDIELALQDGYSTYHGLGLGLPGARRLMDRLDLVSVPGEGTTVTMERWLPPRQTGRSPARDERKAH
jgi:serine/threonine-protein kinase RsbT